MRRLSLLLSAGIAAVAPIVLAQSTDPYKVLKTAKVGGEGGTDYLYADTVGRRLYITRGATQAREARSRLRTISGWPRQRFTHACSSSPGTSTITNVSRRTQ